MVHVVLDRLDDDDGVVDDDADRQHHPEQGQGVDREPEDGEGGEGADQRHRHRQHRDQGGAPALEKEVDDDQYQHQGLEQGLDDLPQRFDDEDRVVDDEIAGDIGGKAPSQLLQLGVDQGRGLDGVGVRGQVDREGGGVAAVVADVEGVILGPEFDPGEVAEADGGAVGLGADDDVLEFGRFGQPAADLDPVLELLVGGRRKLSDLTGRGLDVLLLDRRQDVAGGDAEAGHPVGLEPHPHPELGAEQGDVADPLDPLDRLDDVDRRVVGQKQRVVGPLRRMDGDVHQGVGGALLGRQAGRQHLLRQLGVGLGGAVLDLDRGDVGVGLEVEGDIEGVLAVFGRGRAHVQHLFDAVDLLLDRQGDAVLDDLGVGPRISAADPHRRQGDLRKLGDRQGQAGDDAGQQQEQRDDDGEDGTVDEEPGHGALPLTAEQPVVLSELHQACLPR